MNDPEISEDSFKESVNDSDTVFVIEPDSDNHSNNNQKYGDVKFDV